MVRYHRAPMSADRLRPRTPDPRFARQSHGRGRRLARRRRVRPRGGAERRLDRRARGARAARRRPGRARRQGRAHAPSATCDEPHRAGASRGMDALDQRGLDGALLDLDGTPDKSALGANAILGVSLAVARAAADSAGLPLYRYLGGPAARTLPVPDDERDQRRRARRERARAAGVHADAGRRGVVLRGAALGRRVLPRAARAPARQGLATGVGDEGGFAPELATGAEALELLMQAIELAGLEPGTEVALAMDPAASRALPRRRLPAGGRRRARPTTWSRTGPDLLDRFPIVSLEDALAEDDWEGWAHAHRRARRHACSSSATTCS